MPIWRKLALGILTPFFAFLLFATAFDVGLIKTLTHPKTVKQLISESGIYSSIVPNILQQTKTIQTSLGNFSTTDPVVEKAANQAITPSYIQQYTEAAMDNIYAWLDGKITEPNFKIDLSGAKTNFANQVALSVQQQLSSLPTCSFSQSLSYAQSGSFEVQNANCLPRGVTAATLAGEVKAALINNQNFLSNLSVSAADIKSSGSNQSVFKGKLKHAPKYYQDAKKTPILLIVLTLLTGTGIVFLYSSRLSGLRHLGIILLVIGLLMLLFSWGLNRAVSSQVVPKLKVDNLVLQQDVRQLATDLAQQIDKNYWFFGGLYMLLGVGSIATVEIMKRRTVTLDDAPNQPLAANKDR